MKLRAPLLALASALSILATRSLAGDSQPVVLCGLNRSIAESGWDDAPGDGSTNPQAPISPPLVPPLDAASPSDVEIVPLGEPTTIQSEPKRAAPPMASGPSTSIPMHRIPATRCAPGWAKTPAFDEAYEGIVNDTVDLVLHPNCPDLSRDSCCLPAPWAHRTGVFGEYLFLRPRGTDLTYALPEATAVPSPPVPGAPLTVLAPSGKVGNLDPNYSSGFRVGYTRAIDEFASIRGSYTYYRNSARDTLEATPGNSLTSLVSYPVPRFDFTSSDAASSLGFQFADLDLRKLISYGQHHAINYSIGARYVHLNGGLNVQQRGSFSGTEFVSANSNFDGGGIRFGLDGEHYASRAGLMAYWRGGANFIGGQFREDYNDTYLMPAGPVLVTSHWNGGRLVTILEAEVGIGWSSKSQRMRFRAGYLVNGWFNTIGPGSYLGAVQSSKFNGLSHNFTLDGLTASAEWRF